MLTLWAFSFSNYMFYYINSIHWFSDVKLTLHSWNKFHWLIVYTFLICCWIWFASILLWIFASTLFREFSLWFCCDDVFGLGIRILLASKNVLRSVLSFSNLWKSWLSIGTSFSLKVWKNSPAKPSRPGLFFVDSILITNSMPLYVLL